mgnify:CR=1 FL=1
MDREFELEKIESYKSNELQCFLDEIIDEWEKTNEVYSITDLLEINRELIIREGIK